LTCRLSGMGGCDYAMDRNDVVDQQQSCMSGQRRDVVRNEGSQTKPEMLRCNNIGWSLHLPLSVLDEVITDTHIHCKPRMLEMLLLGSASHTATYSTYPFVKQTLPLSHKKITGISWIYNIAYYNILLLVTSSYRSELE